MAVIDSVEIVSRFDDTPTRRRVANAKLSH
jgi:hypothetical protein